MSHDFFDFPRKIDDPASCPDKKIGFRNFLRDLPWAGCIFSFPERIKLSTERLNINGRSQKKWAQQDMAALANWCTMQGPHFKKSHNQFYAAPLMDIALRIMGLLSLPKQKSWLGPHAPEKTETSKRKLHQRTREVAKRLNVRACYISSWF